MLLIHLHSSVKSTINHRTMRKVSFLLGSLLLFSCSQLDLPTEENNQKTIDEVTKDHFISEETAIKIATSNIKCLEDPSTRSTTRNVKSVERYIRHSRTTRTTDNNVAYYIINYDNNKGFAVVANDDRIIPALQAISEEGNLSLNDTISNPGLRYFFETRTVDPDSFILVGPTHPILPDPIIPTIIEVKPLLHKTVREWSQNWPLNYYCPIVDGKSTKTGCLPLASAMIMSYYEWPKSYAKYNFNWPMMKVNILDDNLAYLIQELGKTENFNVNYGKEESSASENRFIPTFHNFNYPNVKSRDFSASHVMSLLQNNQPVIISAAKTDNINIRHSWVLDGVYYVKGGVAGSHLDPNTAFYYFHCVWGFGGTSNGYFQLSGRNIGGEPIFKEEEDSSIPTVNNYD